ncbi:MAG: hypothetical protein ACOY0T_35655 [Myxococcota bacterium]
MSSESGKLSRARLPNLTPDQWRAVSVYFHDARHAQPDDLANQTGLSPAEAMAILVCLTADGAAQTVITIYHSCENFEMACGAVPFEAGPPTLPWVCPCCARLVEDPAEIALSVNAQTAGRILVDP